MGTELSKLILEPVSKHLPSKKRVVVVGDDALQYIPFQSLTVSAQANKMLVDTHQTVSLPSASVLASLRKTKEQRQVPPKQLAMVADAVFQNDDKRVTSQSQTLSVENAESNDQRSNADLANNIARSFDLSLTRLPGTRREAQAIAALFSPAETVQAYDFDANKEFATNPELSQYKIVHFATHGILNSDRPELSGLVLSLFNEQGEAKNGFLRLYDVFNLDLPVDLVVLSACETGLGKEIKGEGLVGLTRGFMYAGANKVLVSLWNVNDDATAELMTHFYQLMVVNELSPAQALQGAQQKIREQPKWQHPAYWAAFTLQGDWN